MVDGHFELIIFFPSLTINHLIAVTPKQYIVSISTKKFRSSSKTETVYGTKLTHLLIGPN